MSVPRRAVVLLTLTLTAAPLAACGSSSSSGGSVAPSAGTSTTSTLAKPAADEIIRQAVATAKAAKSAHLVADLVTNGSKMHLDLAGQVDGSNQRADVQGQGRNLEILIVGGKLFVKPVDEATATYMGSKDALGKFVPIPDSKADSFKAMTLSSLFSKFTDPGSMSIVDKANTAIDDVTVQGRPAWKISQRVGGDGNEMVVSADGKYELLSLTLKKDGQITFSEWNAVKPFTAPSAAEVYAP